MRLGAPMTLYAFLTFAIFGTPRITIAKALSLSDVAAFSICARLARWYSSSFTRYCRPVSFVSFIKWMAERSAASWPDGLPYSHAIAFVLAIAARMASPWLVLGTEVSPAAITPLLPAVVVQTVLWVLNANLEQYINRELISHRASMALAGLLVLTGGAGVWLHSIGRLDLLTIIHLYTALMGTTLLAQMLILARKGFSFRWCYATLPLVVAPLPLDRAIAASSCKCALSLRAKGIKSKSVFLKFQEMPTSGAISARSKRTQT